MNLHCLFRNWSLVLIAFAVITGTINREPVKATTIAVEDFTGYSTTTANPGSGGFPAGKLDGQGTVANGFNGAWGDPAPAIGSFATGLLYNYVAPTPFNEVVAYNDYVGGGGVFAEISNYNTYYQNNRLLASTISSGSLYWAFLVNYRSVSTGAVTASLVGSGGVVAIGNYASSGTALQAYNVSGLAGSSSAIALMTDNLAVVRIDFDQSGVNDRVRFYLNPNLAAGEGTNVPLLDQTTTNIGTVSRIQIAQYGTGSRAFYDGIRLATTWNDLVAVPEPSSLAMLLFGTIGLLLFRRGRG